jgi:hypothetical protein
MSKAYQFPHDEPNPFTEPIVATPAASDNPYAAGSIGTRPPVPAADAYQKTMPPRSLQLMIMALLSLIGSLLAAALAYFYLPLGIFTLALSVPTWSMARHDLLAMRFGAMDDAAQPGVRTSLGLAIVSTVLGVVSLLLFLYFLGLALYAG